MEKIENNFVKGKKEPPIQEGFNDYLEEREEPILVDKNVPFAETYASLGDIFVSFQFETDEEKVIYLEKEFNRIIEHKLSIGDFSGLINCVKELLCDFLEFNEIKKLDATNPGDAILITEAVNWSAKVSTDFFYMFKPALIIASAKLGAQIGKQDNNGDWPIYYLFNKDVGVASFHDPGFEVESLLRNIGHEGEIKDWEFGWSGITRQDLAFHLISEKEKLFLQRMRYNTLPGENAAEKKKLFEDIEKKYTI